jgi:hypothetical protein
VFTVSTTGVWRSANFGASWSVATFNTTNNGSWSSIGNQSPATVKVSVANPNVVWAASRVSGDIGTTYKINYLKIMD